MESVDLKIKNVRKFLQEVASGEFSEKYPSNVSVALKARLDFEDVISRFKSNDEYISTIRENLFGDEHEK